ncbi:MULTISPECIES: hypothetical protein [unclassified Microcoleus]|uniref:hypothetical protein n=1 Tax=unclassified Microcoleus TaxID=2642155 RepID=UPI002FD45159
MDMINDNEIKLKGLEALVSALGEVQAEKFISLILREPFDYTLWQKDIWSDVGLEELSQKAMNNYKASQPNG